MSAASTFDSTKEFLSVLLKDLANGTTQLPDFQRGWVWDDDHIRSLIASVGSAFPIGAVMMLETGGSAKFQPRPVQGITFAPDKPVPPQRLILDGQQRLTSLFQVTLLGKVVETQNAKKQGIKRWYYLDMHKALSDDVELEDAVLGVPESRVIVNFRRETVLDLSTPESEYANCLFPITRIFDYARWRGEFNKHWKYAQEKVELFDAFESQVLEVFKSYQVPVIVLKRETPKEAVCQVFEKVNTGGVSLNAFELLTATFAADNFSLRDDWYGKRDDPASHGRRGRLQKDPVLKDLKETDFLQAVTLLHTLEVRERYLAVTENSADNAPAVSCKRVAILDLPLAAYEKWAEPATAGFLKAAKLMRLQNVFTARDLPYQTQLVPLAAALTRLGAQADSDGVRRKLARWLWCGVFGELYGGAIESRFAFDLPDLLDWVNGGPEPRTVREALFDPNRLLTLRSRLSAAYKGLHAILMRDGGEDFMSGQEITATVFEDEAIDIHHIFPQKWCKDRDIPSSRFDCIVNKTAISARTNRIIGGNAPSKYLQTLQKSQHGDMSAERMDEVLKTHAIEPALLRADDFDGFFEARRVALLQRIASAMGKPVAGVPVQEPVTETEETVADDSSDDAAELEQLSLA